MTTRASIARYWVSAEGRRRWPDAITDFGEPSCMACGYFSRRWDEGRTADIRWNQAKGLERAHIIAASANGADVPSNYVLLCAKCHAAAPMTHDERMMFAWCTRRASHFDVQINELRDELAALGVNMEALSALASLSREELSDALKRAAGSLNAGTHLCHMSASTRAVAMMRMAEELASRPASSPHEQRCEHVTPDLGVPVRVAAKPAPAADPRQLDLFGSDP